MIPAMPSSGKPKFAHGSNQLHEEESFGLGRADPNTSSIACTNMRQMFGTISDPILFPESGLID